MEETLGVLSPEGRLFSDQRSQELVGPLFSLQMLVPEEISFPGINGEKSIPPESQRGAHIVFLGLKEDQGGNRVQYTRS